MKWLDRVARRLGYVPADSVPILQIVQKHDRSTFIAVEVPQSGTRFSGWLSPWRPEDGDPWQQHYVNGSDWRTIAAGAPAPDPDAG